MWKIKILVKSKKKNPNNLKIILKKPIQNVSNCNNFSPKGLNYIKETFSALIILATGDQSETK